MKEITAIKINSSTDKWHEYERLKRELQRMNLTPKQYEWAIQKIVRKLGI